MQITELKPQKVFKYFAEIAAIPHGSGNTGKLAQYCVDFAKARGLRYFVDDAGNVMIFADATAGYEQSEPIILQGYLDMVCDKEPDCPIDMDNEGVKLCTDGEYVWADGTTLGGDDGIAIAYILALLDSDDIPHPPVEALLTVDEEVGMVGARALDASQLKGKRLINIDSEAEGVLTVSCAGSWKPLGALCGSWMGGTGNMLAIQAALGVGEDQMVYALVMDSICAVFYVMFLLWVISFSEKFNKWTKADTTVIDEVGRALEEEAKANTKPITWQNLAILLGSSLRIQ